MTKKFEKIRLLLVDDDPDDRMLVLKELGKEFGNVEANEIADEVSFNIAIEEGGFDVVITDYHLKWSNGIEVLKKVKVTYPHCPVLMFTGTGSEEIAVEAMKEGLDDYILKSPKHFIKLPVAVLSAIEKSRAKIEHEQAEKELRESEERYRTLFETSPVAVIVIGTDGTIIDCNHASAAMVDLGSRKELIGKKIDEIEFIEEESLLRLSELFSKFLKGEISGIFETQIKLKDRVRWIEIYPSFLKRNGKIYAVQAVIRDITERKLIEKTLKKREEEYRTVVDNANESIIVIQDGLIRFANPKTYEIGGYSKDDITLKPFIEFVHPEDREIVLQNYKKRLKGDKISHTYSIRVFGKDGKIIWVDVNAVLVEWEGKPATLNFLTDVTDRMKSEEKLQKSEERYRQLVEMMNEGVGVLDERGIFTYVNKRFCEMIGYSMDEIVGKPAIEFLDEENRKILTEQIRKREKRIREYYELAWRHRSGKKIPTIMSPQSVFDSEGNYKGCFAIITDISSIKVFEKALKESEARLKSIFRAAPIGLGIVVGRVFESVNDKFCEMLGYSREELVGNNAKMVYLDDKEYERAGIEKYRQIRKYGIGSIETKFRRKDGRIIDVLLSTSLIDPSNPSKGMIFTAMDVTERKKAIKMLEESERKYRTTFEHTGTAMVIIEEDTTLSLVNSEFEKLSGYRKEEIEGKMSWTQFVHPEDLERMEGYHHARRKGEYAPKKYEFRFIDREGNLKDIFLTIDLISGTKKTVASLIDISWIKRLNNLLKSISEINELVAREKNPKIVLKTVCDKLTLVYDAVFTSLVVNEELIPVESKGISLKSIENAIKRCPSVLNAIKGVTGKMRMDDETCKHCTKTPHKFVLSTPLAHDGIQGVITIHSSTDFNEDEMTLLEKLSRNIAFAISAYKIESDKRKAFEQLATNLMQFEHSADRLRNPLAVIMSSLELRDEIDHERLIEIIDESAKRIKKELDEMRREEIKTFKLMEDMK